MPHVSPLPAPLPAPGPAADLTDRTAQPGLQARRRLVLALVTATVLLGTGLMAWTLSAGGLDWLDGLAVLCLAMTLPWAAMGLWNAVIGLLVMRFSADPVQAVCPVLVAADDRAAIGTSTAILSCIRNEDADTVARNLDRIVDELAAAGVAGRFQVYVLSDSTWPEAIAAEEAQVARLADRWRGVIPITYRRRAANPGFKAGNIRDFCERWGDAHDFAVVLDADSLMAADTILRMVRTMQAQPRLGILQTLMVGLPTTSPFARPFQFGMRLGMRSYSIGSAWWQGDAGPYWGHNALIRLAPFIEHCALPPLPGRGPLAGAVLSHDQVEAALMRRAGFEVRVMPVEVGSWEENPPTLPEFIRRDLRWCQGNLQYLKLRLPGLHPVSRAHLALAVLMFAASPAWVALMLIGVARLALPADGPVYLPGPGLALFWLVMGMIFAPKLATVIDTLASADARRRFGGGPRLLIGVAAEVGFSMLLAPIMAIAHSVFIGGLLAGRAVVWEPQRRGVHRVRIGAALRWLWPQTLVGAAALGLALTSGAAAGLLLSPFFAGALLAVPLAVASASPALGLLLARIGLWRTPDETEPAPIVAALHLPALAANRALPPAVGSALEATE